MHVVFVIAPGGGPEANVKTLAPEYERRGHRISVIYAATKEKVAAGWSNSISFKFAPPGSVHYYAAKLNGGYRAWPVRLRAWEQAMAVRKVLNKLQNDQPIDIVEVTEGFPLSALGGRWPVVVRAHGSAWTFRTFCGDGETRNDRWLISAQRQQFLKASSASALSVHLADHLRGALELSSPIEVIPYGIDIDTFRPSSNGRASERPVLLSVGRLERRKGMDLFLRAMASVWHVHPGAEVHLVGSESEFLRQDLLALVPPERQTQVFFPGFLNRDELVERYRRATIYVAPTQYETFGYTILEAMACGKSVVSTRVGAVPELVDDGDTGLLVNWNDPAALAGAIMSLLDDPAKVARMGKAGREKAEAMYSLDRVVQRNLDSYQRALS
ncbi:MAG TPA: glycosyltransferase family 4 protein [Pyrinomonadaceae bacterium]|nr:glycosyltransferase family 4 protein [Pyrinomonadaceae bacterium]